MGKEVEDPGHGRGWEVGLLGRRLYWSQKDPSVVLGPGPVEWFSRPGWGLFGLLLRWDPLGVDGRLWFGGWGRGGFLQ